MANGTPMAAGGARLDLATQPRGEGQLPRAIWLYLPVAVAVIVATLYTVAPDWTWRYLLREGLSAVEMSHFLIPLAAFMFALRGWLRLPPGSDNRLSALLLALAAGSAYIAGEEVSWGQTFIGWDTPDAWSEVNRQDETNLHNATSWLNQKPRVLLNVCVLLAVVVLPVMQARGIGERLLGRIRFVLPPREVRPVGLLVLFYMTWDHLAKDGVLPKIASREAEMHEFFLYSFILIYAWALARRIEAWRRDRAAPADPAA